MDITLEIPRGRRSWHWQRPQPCSTGAAGRLLRGVYAVGCGLLLAIGSTVPANAQPVSACSNAAPTFVLGAQRSEHARCAPADHHGPSVLSAERWYPDIHQRAGSLAMTSAGPAYWTTPDVDPPPEALVPVSDPSAPLAARLRGFPGRVLVPPAGLDPFAGLPLSEVVRLIGHALAEAAGRVRPRYGQTGQDRPLGCPGAGPFRGGGAATGSSVAGWSRPGAGRVGHPSPPARGDAYRRGQSAHRGAHSLLAQAAARGR
jgi:hypothetical protein